MPGARGNRFGGVRPSTVASCATVKAFSESESLVWFVAEAGWSASVSGRATAGTSLSAMITGRVCCGSGKMVICGGSGIRLVRAGS